MRFQPHLTVATIVESNGRFLMVEENQAQGLVINQPAGHLEANETLVEAAVRETLEETGWTVRIDSLVGLYLFVAANGETYQRVCFAGSALAHDPQRPLDDGIVSTRWMDPEELRACADRHRSHLVLQCVLDYLDKPRYPLELIR